jgi:hypothetical protein
MKNLFLFSFLLINLALVAQRDPRPKDQANVFWDGTYPLYSLTSDQEIKTSSSGKYDFWGTTNENPVPKEYSLPKGSVLYVYKFISYDECLKFSNVIRQQNGMQLLNANQQNNTVITTPKTDTIFTGQLVKSRAGYSGNGEIKYPNGFRYKGGIINNKPDGKPCEIQTAKGSLFVGNFKLNDSKISGNGSVNPGDGEGGFKNFESQKGEFIENPNGSGAQLVNGFYEFKQNDLTRIQTMKNGAYVSIKTIVQSPENNTKLEVDMPSFKDDIVTGNYTASFYKQNVKKIEYELEVSPNKTTSIKKIKDGNGVVYSSDLTFGSTPLTLTSNTYADFLNLRGPFKRISDGKTFYLDGNGNITETQSISQHELTKEQFFETVNKDQNNIYACDCCKKSINGYKNGITSDGDDYSDFFDMHAEQAYIYYLVAIKTKLINRPDFSPISFVQSEYPYCSKFCYKTCKE